MRAGEAAHKLANNTLLANTDQTHTLVWKTCVLCFSVFVNGVFTHAQKQNRMKPVSFFLIYDEKCIFAYE